MTMSNDTMIISICDYDCVQILAIKLCTEIATIQDYEYLNKAMFDKEKQY